MTDEPMDAETAAPQPHPDTADENVKTDIPDADTAEASVKTDSSDADSPAADSGPNAEAAKYRRRLREAETKLAVADARAEMLTRREIERLASDRLADGTEIWNDGTEVDSLIGDDGMPSPEAVAARVAELVEAHPHWRRVDLKRLTPPASSVSGNVVPISDGPAASWGQVLQRRG